MADARGHVWSCYCHSATFPKLGVGTRPDLKPQGGLEVLQMDESVQFSIAGGLSHLSFATQGWSALPGNIGKCPQVIDVQVTNPA